MKGRPMKKKKTIKKKPKRGRAKAGAKKVRITELTDFEKRALLYQKIAQVRKALPQIEATGKDVDSETGEEINYTEAHVVFEKYQKVFDKVGLVVRPTMGFEMRPDVQVKGAVVIVTMFFEIADPDTGYALVGPGIGMGANRDWSGNTAQTRALKQFLLTSFGAYWRDPEQQRRMDDKLLKQEVADQLGPGLRAVTEEIKEFFGEYLKKGKVENDTQR